MKKTFLFTVLSIFIFSVTQAQYEPSWQSLDKRPVPGWYQDAKFGIFIHWGVYSVPAWSPVGNYSEWYQNALVDRSYQGAVADYHQKKYGGLSYYQLADQFKAGLFNPDAWAQLFEKSGAKYVVLTSKHHDGFCLWPDTIVDRDRGFAWNAAEVGPKQDLVGKLFAALRKTSVRPGLYYSLYEWFDSLYKKNPEEYAVRHAIPQMKELINQYKPDILWTDGDWDQSDTAWHTLPFLAWLFNDSPVKDSIVSYDRWGRGIRFHHGGVYTPEYEPDLNFNGHYFEESQGMGYSYGYNQAEDAWNYSSAQSFVLHLVDIVSRGGNFLLDIGPTADGKIPPIMQERLLQMGEWLAVNGDAIYGTHPWKLSSQWSAGDQHYKPVHKDSLLLKQTLFPDPGYAVKEMFFTRKNNELYCILPRYPANRTVVIRDLTLKKGTTIIYLGNRNAVSWVNHHGNVVITMPAYDPNTIQSTYAYVLQIKNIDPL
jgi:alpha-L-fucosidase